MDVKKYLKNYAQKADKTISAFLVKKIADVKEAGKGGYGVGIAVDMLKRYQSFSSGGKKLRGALIKLGYEIAGGKKNGIIAASTSIELIHSFLLMHDDIMDMDSLRRGMPTIHKQYETKYKGLKFNRDSQHFGLSMGINMGDLGAYLGVEAILGSDLPIENKLEAAKYLSRLLQRVAFGQGLDVSYERLSNISEKKVFEVHLQKTSVYTVGGPLKIGAILGGLSKQRIEAIENFGEPVGIAFQLRDDELGLFSSEEELGKPVGSDIREGKNTLLKIKAVKKAKGKDKDFLTRTYGKKDLTLKDVERVRSLTVATGALEYSQEKSRELIAKGKRYIPMITKEPYFQDALASFADFMIERNS